MSPIIQRRGTIFFRIFKERGGTLNMINLGEGDSMAVSQEISSAALVLKVRVRAIKKALAEGRIVGYGDDFTPGEIECWKR